MSVNCVTIRCGVCGEWRPVREILDAERPYRCLLCVGEGRTSMDEPSELERLRERAERAEADLAAERQRNAPLRARIKEQTDRADRAELTASTQAAETINAGIKLWYESNVRFHRRASQAERERDAACMMLRAVEAHLTSWSKRGNAQAGVLVERVRAALASAPSVSLRDANGGQGEAEP